MVYLISITHVICSIAASLKFGVWTPAHVGVQKYYILDMFITCALCWFRKWILSTHYIQNKVGNIVCMCLGGQYDLKCHILFMLCSFTLYLSVGWMEWKSNTFPSGILKQWPEFSHVQYLISKILPLLYWLGIVFKLLSIYWMMGSD